MCLGLYGLQSTFTTFTISLLLDSHRKRSSTHLTNAGIIDCCVLKEFTIQMGMGRQPVPGNYVSEYTAQHETHIVLWACATRDSLEEVTSRFVRS